MPRRSEPKAKAKTQAEIEADRRPTKLPQKEKRMSGKSWRQWADDDEVGDDGLGGMGNLGSEPDEEG
jgi:hypothetical protein